MHLKQLSLQPVIHASSQKPVILDSYMLHTQPQEHHPVFLPWHTAEAKHCARPQDNHTKAVSQQRAKRNAVCSQNREFLNTELPPASQEWHLLRSGLLHMGLLQLQEQRHPAQRALTAPTAHTPKALIWTALCANIHTTTSTSEGPPDSQEASRQTDGTLCQICAAKKQQLRLCQEEE